MKPTFSLHGLGCRVNQTEAESFRTLLRESGFREVAWGKPADVSIVHTCTVTQMADAKSRQAMHKAKRANPDTLLVVSGCYAQVASEEIRAQEAPDVLVGTQDREETLKTICEALVQKRPKGPVDRVHDVLRTRCFEELPTPSGGRTRGFVKIQEGCQQFCTYCIIPYARGPVRSRDPDSVLEEVRSLQARGYREIVLTGIHTGAYGQDLDGFDLADLLVRIRKTGMERIRLGSLDPKEFTPQLKRVLFSGAPFMPHLHISLQSGDDDVLRRMRRGYDSAQYRDLLKDLRAHFDHVAITTDVMVGFPGESAAMHERSLAFVEEMAFADLHVFPYSPRKGTKAAGFSHQIEESVKEMRAEQMKTLQIRLRDTFLQGQKGRAARVLIEKERVLAGGIERCEGYAEDFMRTRIETDVREGSPACRKNSIVDVEITGRQDGILLARPTGGK